MARNLYCWRCDMVLPMLEDHEWEIVAPLLGESLSGLQRYRQENGVSLAEARDRALGQAALDRYRELTGFNETNINALWHHHVGLHGPPCACCGKPLRTPKAGFCAACGTVRA